MLKFFELLIVELIMEILIVMVHLDFQVVYGNVPQMNVLNKIRAWFNGLLNEE